MRTLTLFADANAAAQSIQSDLVPILSTVTTIATALFALFILIGGLYYMTAATSVERKIHAKDILTKGSAGFLIVLTCTSGALFLQSAYADRAVEPAASNELKLEKVDDSSGNFMTDVVKNFLIDVVKIGDSLADTLNNFFTKTPLMADTAAVFNVWKTVLVIAISMFALVIALMGFNLMTASVFGFKEGELRTLLPRIAGGFIVMAFSIFIIDFFISIANMMTKALIAGSDNQILITTIKAFIGGVASWPVGGLILVLVLVILLVLLLLYYLRRLVVLYIGAALAPIIVLCYLLPVFRDFAILATRQYIMTIFIVFVHMVILLLAAVLFNSFGNESILTLLLAIATMSVLIKAGSTVNQMLASSGMAQNTKQMAVAFMRGKSQLVDNYKSAKGEAGAPSGSKFANQGEKSTTSSVAPIAGGGSKVSSGSGKFQDIPHKTPGVRVTRVPEQTSGPRAEISKPAATPSKMKRQSVGAEG